MPSRNIVTISLESFADSSELSVTQYTTDLITRIAELQKTYPTTVMPPSGVPNAGIDASAQAHVDLIHHQGFLATISASRAYVITCNPYNALLHQQFAADIPIRLVDPRLYIRYVALQHHHHIGPGLLTLLMLYADSHQSTDIHICHTTQIMIKRNHTTQITLPVFKDDAQKLAYLIKLKANMDPGIVLKPQDGSLSFEYATSQLDVRVATIPTHTSEMVSLRLFNPSIPLQHTESLGFSHQKLQAIDRMIRAPFGLVLITGATGSGKSTTLYSLLRRLTHKHVITIEDPIEQIIPNVHQTAVNVAQGYGFDVGLRAILRHNPDIIAVGEIRDQHTAEVALHAAYSGHLVLASLHTNAIDTTLLRLSSLGCSPFLISYCLRGIISQSLSLSSEGVFELTSHLLLCKDPPYIIQDITKELSDFLNYNILLS